MRLPFPRRRPNEGIWGGFGSKAPDKAYQPPVGSHSEPRSIPKRHRRLRLRKVPLRKILRRQEKPTFIECVIAALLGLTILVLVIWLLPPLLR